MKSTKPQHPSSRETSMTNIQTIWLREEASAIGCAGLGDWSLKFGISLELGAWNLEF
jgi:hypothetical protein